MKIVMKIYREIRDFVLALNRNSVGAYSAAATFFAVISLSPFALLIMKLQTAPLALLTVAGVSAIWAASHCMFLVIRELNKLYRVEEARNWFKLRLLSVLYTLVLQLMLTVSFSIFGIAVLFGLFLFVYRVMPNAKLPLKHCLPGAAVATVGWLGLSWGFRFADFARVYGELATVVSSLMWLYFCMFLLFSGALLNVTIVTIRDKSRGSRTLSPPSPTRRAHV